MSKTQANSYTSEFRESAVKLAIDSNQPISKTSKELGVNVSTLHTWISKYSQVKPARVNRTDEHLYDELKHLKKEVTRLKEERDILKKAAVYFASESR